MREHDFAGILIFLKHREIDNPAEGIAVFTKLAIIGNLDAGTAGERGGFGFGRAGEKHRIPVGKSELISEFKSLIFAKSLGHRSTGFALGIDDIPHPRSTLALGPGVHAICHGPAAATRPGNGADNGTCFDGSGKNCKPGAAEGFRDVMDDDRYPQIRLIGAVVEHGIGKGDAPERGDNISLGEFLKNPGNDRFHRSKNIVLLNKAHFKVELIELTRATVSAAVFITEAGGDLEIPVKAGDHDQLFELLWRLRQGVEFTGMKAGRDQKITGTFR